MVLVRPCEEGRLTVRPLCAGALNLLLVQQTSGECHVTKVALSIGKVRSNQSPPHTCSGSCIWPLMPRNPILSAKTGQCQLPGRFCPVDL